MCAAGIEVSGTGRVMKSSPRTSAVPVQHRGQRHPNDECWVEHSKGRVLQCINVLEAVSRGLYSE